MIRSKASKVLFVLASLVTTLVFWLHVPRAVYAQEEPSSSGVTAPEFFPLPPGDPGFLGQDHSY